MWREGACRACAFLLLEDTRTVEVEASVPVLAGGAFHSQHVDSVGTHFSTSVLTPWEGSCGGGTFLNYCADSPEGGLLFVEGSLSTYSPAH